MLFIAHAHFEHTAHIDLHLSVICCYIYVAFIASYYVSLSFYGNYIAYGVDRTTLYRKMCFFTLHRTMKP